jgi:hypothetical protein
MRNNKPNIFHFATSELSQDIFIAWLLRWASPEFKEANIELHNCGLDALKLFIGNLGNIGGSKIKKVVTHRQWENIDIWIKVYFENGDKLFLIVEDKTYTSEHSGQLERYKNTAQKWADSNGFRLGCVYFKIGSEQQKVLANIREKGYSIIGRKEILTCLNNHLNIQDSFVADYIQHLQYLDKAHQAFLTTPPNEWKKENFWKEWPWIGLYQFIESQISINVWHRVNNLGGGFWNLCLNWGHWHGFTLYLQIEQGNLCYKIALEEGKKKFKLSEADTDRIQDFAFQKLMSFSNSKAAFITKPERYAHKGKYRTFAIVQQDKWLGNKFALINTNAVIENLKSQIQVYESYMAELRMFAHVDAGIKVADKT